MTPELLDHISRMAFECKSQGAVNAALVMYVLVGAIMSEDDYSLAALCKEYGMVMLEKLKGMQDETNHRPPVL